MVKIGIIGSDRGSEKHILILKNLLNVKLTGIFDPEEELTGDLADKYALTYFSDIVRLINESDALFVSSHISRRFLYVTEAIKKFKHVFVENIFSYAITEVQELYALAVEAGVLVRVGDLEKYNPTFLAAKEHINKPLFIDIHCYVCDNSKLKTMVAVPRLLRQNISLVMEVAQSEIKHVRSKVVQHNEDGNNTIHLYVEFENGCVGNIVICTVEPESRFELKVFQESLKVFVDLNNQKVMLSDDSEGFKEVIKRESDISSLQLSIENFIRDIISGRYLTYDISHAIQVAKVSNEILNKSHFGVVAA